MKWPNLIFLHYLDRKDKLKYKSVMDTEIEKRSTKGDEAILIVLVTIFILFFFARNVQGFLILLFSGVVVAIFALIKNYKERRRK
jgi:hypothetical protein